MSRSKGVIIGCGAIAREHLTAIDSIDNATIVGVCDLSPTKAQATAERFGVPTWSTDFKRLIAGHTPDLVHITTPPSAHVSIAEYCLAEGMNVLCEKPIVTDYRDFEKLRLLAQSRKCYLVENQNLRYHSSVQRIRHLISDGHLGDVVDVQIQLFLNLYGLGNPFSDDNTPHFSRALKGGPIGDFLPHIAYLSQMFAGHITELHTLWSTRRSGSTLPADEFRALMRGTAATASVEFSGNIQPNGFWLRVMGTRMSVEADLFNPPRLSIRKLRPGEQALMTVFDGVAEARDIFRGSIAGLGRKLGGTSSYDGLKESLQDVYDCLREAKDQPITLEEIDRTTKLVDRFTEVGLST